MLQNLNVVFACDSVRLLAFFIALASRPERHAIPMRMRAMQKKKVLMREVFTSTVAAYSDQRKSRFRFYFAIRSPSKMKIYLHISQSTDRAVLIVIIQTNEIDQIINNCVCAMRMFTRTYLDSCEKVSSRIARQMKYAPDRNRIDAHIDA